MNILILNTGSNSLKFEIITIQSNNAPPDHIVFGNSLLTGSYEDIGKDHSAFTLWEKKQVYHKEETVVRDHGHATELLLSWIEQGGAREKGIHNLANIERIGHRVVHGGDYFSAPVRITDEVLRRIEEFEDLAPLHNLPALKVIRAAQTKAGSRVPMIAVFDTVFHQTIPEEAALYPLPLDLARRHRIRRYGFHGISHRYLMLRYAQIRQRSLEDIKLITLHLEGGCSAAAIRYGQSIDTSMGFTPLEGLMMATRSGDLDPALITYLMRKESLDARGIETLLNKQSGLLGMSGKSADTRELREHLSDPAVNLALNVFCYRVRKYLGAYLAALEGTEAIVFGGGIGENTAVVRERICEKLGWCGAFLDFQKNNEVIDREAPITTPESPVQVWVIPTQEGLMMANEVAGCK